MSSRCDQTYVTETDLAYALVEYDLACEPLKCMRGQILADFIVEHRINDKHDLEVGYIVAHHGSCTLMDRFVMMVKGLVLFLILRMVLFLNFQTDWKKSAQITKLNMKLFYLAWNS